MLEASTRGQDVISCYKVSRSNYLLNGVTMSLAATPSSCDLLLHGVKKSLVPTKGYNVITCNKGSKHH